MARKKKYDYFAAFEAQMDLAIEEADLLNKVVKHFETAEDIADVIPQAHEIEHKADSINHETYAAIAADFITPIDRDDIVAIASALDDIVDDTESVIHLFYMFDVHFMHHDVDGVVKIIRKSCESLKLALHEFVNAKKEKKKFRQAVEKVNELEESADELYEQNVHKLYTVDADNPLRVMVWTRIFDALETIVDDCEHVADLLSSIAVTNS